MFRDTLPPIKRKKSRRPYATIPFKDREFIAWDGEGVRIHATDVTMPDLRSVWSRYHTLSWEAIQAKMREMAAEVYAMREEPTPQPYVLLANSKKQRIISNDPREGLSTEECFDFILQTKAEFPNSIFVGYGFTYDCAQMFKDLPKKRLEMLWDTNKTFYRNYKIEYRPRKWITIMDSRKRMPSARIFDVIGYFQKAFLTTCKEYLGGSHPDLQIIERGKDARDVFTFEELDDFIIPYNDTELRMLVEIMNILRKQLETVGLNLTSWHGPGAVSSAVLQKRGVKAHMSKDIPREVTNAAQYAYAGGRFEHFQLGRHQGRIYEYDIRSAYPSAAVKLPSLSNGTWRYAETFEPGSFGVWHTEYLLDRQDPARGYLDPNPIRNRPQPLFCRSKEGRVSFPQKTEGWYWTPEAGLVPDFVQYGYVWDATTDDRPFDFIREVYEQRRHYKEVLHDPVERALKLILNSIYGKLAQLMGTDDKAPVWHQLEWAGYITSYTRAMIYQAILLNPDAIIACETDAVFSTEPLPLTIGKGLGEWELETFEGITYLQNGVYYADREDGSVVCRYRGMDRDRKTQQPVGLSYRDVLDHLSNSREPSQWRTPPLFSTSTRFINIGYALRTGRVFRSWEKENKAVYLDQDTRKSKRRHVGGSNSGACPKCKEGLTLADCLHPMLVSGYRGHSHRHQLPWLANEQDPGCMCGFNHPKDTEELDFYLAMERIEAWQ